MPKAKILVTGGAGYIGSHVLKLLGKNDYEVVVVDNLSTGRKDAVLHGELVVEDLANREAIDQLFATQRFDGVIHFAGSIIVPESVTDPLKYYRNNVVNSINLLESCKKWKVKNLIFSSTAAVYGLEGSGLNDESTPTVPINPYGDSKLMIEQVLKDLSFAEDFFNHVCLRYFNVAGADPELETGQVGVNATHLIKVAMEVATGQRDKLEVYGTDYDTADGTCIRDYIHVMDLAQAHIDALDYLLKGGKSDTFNCGYSQGFSVREVLSAVEEVTGKKLNVSDAPRRAGDAASLVAKSDKIRQTLGWAPKLNDIKTIVKTAYDWEKSRL